MAEKEKVETEIVDEEEKIEDPESEDKEPELTIDQQIENLNQEIEKWKNDYYKVFADMENVKRRMKNEHESSLKFMMQNFIEELLPVIDNFERSLVVTDPSEEVNNFLKGYEMIYGQLMTVLRSQGLEVIDTKDKEFDPNYHQAISTEKVDGVKPNMIIEELQKGYMLKDRVIRASLVKVSE